MENTVFHKFAVGELRPARVRFEDEDILAFDSNDPKAPVHVLLIPKSKAIVSIADMEEEDIVVVGKLFYRAKLLAEELGVAEAGYRLAFNVREGGGQTVNYLHLHLLAGKRFGE